MGADVIQVREGGRIVESGTHAELLAQDGVYAELAAQQIAAARVLATEAAVERTVTGGVATALSDRRADRAPDDSASADATGALTASVPLRDAPTDDRVSPPQS